MFAYYLIAALLYIFAIAFLYAPKCPTAPEAEAPVNYFPDVQEPEPSAEAPAVAVPSEAEAPPSVPTPAPEPVAQALDLHSLPYSELKSRAKALKIPRYSRLSKAELIGALA